MDENIKKVVQLWPSCISGKIHDFSVNGIKINKKKVPTLTLVTATH